MPAPILEWRQPFNPKDPQTAHYPLLLTSPVREGTFVAMQGARYKTKVPDAFTPYVTYKKWLREAAKANGIPGRTIIKDQRLEVKPVDNTGGVVRSSFFPAALIKHERTRHQYLGFTDNKNYSPPIQVIRAPGFFRRLIKFGIGGGPTGGQLILEAQPLRDPEIRIDLLFPWGSDSAEGTTSSRDLIQREVEDFVEDLAPAVDANVDQIIREVEDFLPEEIPRGWTIDLGSEREFWLGEGERKEVVVNFDCPTSGSLAFAIKAQTEDGEEFYSSVMFLSSTGEGVFSMPFLENDEATMVAQVIA